MYCCYGRGLRRPPGYLRHELRELEDKRRKGGKSKRSDMQDMEGCMVVLDRLGVMNKFDKGRKNKKFG